MRFTRGVVIVVALIYIFLWVLALNGASNLIAPLAVPLVLAVLVAFGVWLNRFMGIAPRHQHFEPRRGEVAPVSPTRSVAVDDQVSADPTSHETQSDEDPTSETP